MTCSDQGMALASRNGGSLCKVARPRQINGHLTTFVGPHLEDLASVFCQRLVRRVRQNRLVLLPSSTHITGYGQKWLYNSKSAAGSSRWCSRAGGEKNSLPACWENNTTLKRTIDRRKWRKRGILREIGLACPLERRHRRRFTTSGCVDDYKLIHSV